MKVLIDGDIVAHRVAWTVEDQETFGIPRWRCDEMLDGILHDTGASEFSIYLSGQEEDNFRYQIYPRYKESRKGKPRPKWLEEIKAYLVTDWKAAIACGMEADDALGINQINQFNDNGREHTTIASIDKDLLQIPGIHYNFVKKEHAFVTYIEGLKSFYRQILTGDSGDDIPGLDGIGPVKSGKFLATAQSESELLSRVYGHYLKRYGQPELAKELIERNGSLLKIKQKEDEGIWQAPWHLLTPTAVELSLSTPQTPEVIAQSMEPIITMESGLSNHGPVPDTH